VHMMQKVMVQIYLATGCAPRMNRWRAAAYLMLAILTSESRALWSIPSKGDFSAIYSMCHVRIVTCASWGAGQRNSKIIA
jgi:hypothetical protein